MFNFMNDSISVGLAADQNSSAVPQFWILVSGHYVLAGAD
jgi:hypothetical protein